MSTNSARYYCTHLSWIDRADGLECPICEPSHATVSSLEVAEREPVPRHSSGGSRFSKVLHTVAAYVGVGAFLLILGLVSAAINNL